MALPVTETFTASDGDQVDNLANWTKVTATDLDIFSNSAAPDGSGEIADRWDADAFNNDQYAEGTIVAAGSDVVGVAVRCSDSAATYYGWYGTASSGSWTFKMVAGSWTQLGSEGADFSSSDAIRLEVSGTTLTPKIGGVTESPPGAQTDGTISSGYSGITGYGNGTTSRIDDWEGGNLGNSQAATGTLGSSGVLSHKTLKTLAGLLTPVGTLARRALRAIAGAITPSGSLATVRTQTQTTTGTITPSGSLDRKALKDIAGSIAPSGSLTRKTLKALAGSLTPSGTLSPVKAADEIFHITHEPGDLSEYTSTVTGGGDLSVTGAAALIGSYGLGALINDTGSIYGQVDFTQLTSTAYGFRLYFDPNGLTMATSDTFDGARILESTSTRALLRIIYEGGSYKVKLRAIDDAAASQDTAYYTITDDVHWIEGTVEYASSAVASDAQITLRIDGVQQEQKTALDIYDVSKPDNARFGAVAGLDAGTSGTFYLDDIVLRDDATEIGSAGNQQAATGNIIPSGSLASRIGKVLAGAITPTGSLTRKTLKHPTGSITPTGSLATVLFKTQVVAGAITPSGALGRKALKTLAGAIAPSGALSTVHLADNQQAAAGSIAPAGSQVRKTLKPLAGSLTPTSALARKTIKPLAGSIAPTSALARKTFEVSGGSLTPAGALSTIHTRTRTVTGAITPSGSLARKVARSLTGEITSSGALAHKTLKVLAGTITSTGALSAALTKVQAAVGSLAPAGALVRKSLKETAGAIAPSGAVATVLFKAWAATGSLTPSSLLARKTLKVLAGALTPAGALVRKTLKPLASSLAPSGTLATVLFKAQAPSGSLTPSGLLSRKTLKSPSGAIALTGSLNTAHARTLAVAGSLASSGSLARSLVGAIITYEETGLADLILGASGADSIITFIEDIDIFTGNESMAIKAATEEIEISIGNETILIRTAK